MDTPRIYVRCLAAYNSGVLHGTWIDCDQSADDIKQEITDMLAASPESESECSSEECDYEGPPEDGECPDCGEPMHQAEEWAIHDYEGFGNYRISEYEDIDSIAELTESLEGMDDSQASAYLAYLDNMGEDPGQSSRDGFEEAYRGCWSSLEDWAEEFLSDTGGLDGMPDNLRFYFDYEQYAQDCVLGGDIWTHEDEYGTHVFDNI